MPVNSIQVSVRGKWVSVPALNVKGKTIAISGRWIKIAAVRSEEWLETELEDPEACVRELMEQRSHGLRADIFTFTQKLPATLPKYRYDMEWESIAAARITRFKEWWEKLPQESRKNVRRSQKRGVVVKITDFNDDLVREIVEVNNDSQIRQGRRFPHYNKTHDQVKQDHSSFLDRSEFICAYLGDELIGFLKIVYRGEVASIMQLLSKSSHYDKRPSNALVARAVEQCEARGIQYLTYGKYNYGNKRDSSLREFKTRLGLQEILVPRFHLPLTVWGTLCLRLGLHRGLLGILPRSAIAFGVTVRAKWYIFRNFIGRCSSIVEQPNRNRQMECSNPPAGSSPESRMALPVSQNNRKSARDTFSAN
jgi:hypothetical protein